MKINTALKSPFPYFGGKSAIAPVVWRYLGNPDRYIEPFFGSGAGIITGLAFETTSLPAFLRFAVIGSIVAQGRPRLTTINGFARAFDPMKSRTYKQVVGVMAKKEMMGKAPIIAPVAVDLRFYFQAPRSWSKKKRAAALCGEIKPAIKPDIDNIIKAVLDGINGVCFADDKQVVSLSAVKIYGHPERVEVEIREP